MDQAAYLVGYVGGIVASIFIIGLGIFLAIKAGRGEL
jgi:hypothetical protein